MAEIRMLRAYSNATEELAWEQQLEAFSLPAFQMEFSVKDSSDPMYDCWPVKERHISFLEHYIHNVYGWDFKRLSYFLEAVAA